MRRLLSILLVAGLVFCFTGKSWAPTATATFYADIPSRVSIALNTDDSSIAADPTQVRFDLVDSDDPGVSNPNAGYMYAPHRSSVNSNWHIAEFTANNSATLSLTVDATLYGIDKSKLRVWFGGFFAPGTATPVDGTASIPDTNPPYGWEAMGSSKSAAGPFTGTCPFNYQLNIGDVAAGVYGGEITFTLIQ